MRKIRNRSLRIVAAFLSLVMTFSFMTYRPQIANAEEETDLREVADQIIVLVNEARAKEGLNPLKAVPYLNDKARERSRELIFDFSHYRPGRRVFYLTNEREFTIKNVDAETTELIARQLDEKRCGAVWSEDKKSFRVGAKKMETVEEILIGEDVGYSSIETLEGFEEKIAAKGWPLNWSEDKKSFSVEKKYETAVNKFLKNEGVKYTMGDLFITILDTGLVPYYNAGENTAGSSVSGIYAAYKVFKQWESSSVHWHAIMNPVYTHIGVGVSYEPDSDFKYYYDQIFIATDKVFDDEYIPDMEVPREIKVQNTTEAVTSDTITTKEAETTATTENTTKTTTATTTVLPTVTLPVDESAEPVGSGDINGDEEITSFDLIAINQYLGGKIGLNSRQMESADLLKDNMITVADAVVLRKYILGRYKTIPVTMEMFLNG